MKLNMLTLKWNDELGVGSVGILAPYKDADYITKLDFLTDCIYDLQKLHDAIFEERRLKRPDTDTTALFEALGWAEQLTKKGNDHAD
jgi:hypothetical protein